MSILQRRSDGTLVEEHQQRRLEALRAAQEQRNNEADYIALLEACCEQGMALHDILRELRCEKGLGLREGLDYLRVLSRRTEHPAVVAIRARADAIGRY